MEIKENFVSEFFYKVIDLFIDCIRTDKNIYIAIIIIFCLFFSGVMLCIVTYYRNRQHSNIRLRMVSYGLLSLTCFCITILNLLFTWQIAIPASIITIPLICKERRICYSIEIKKQLSENILNDKNSIFNPFYTRLNFLFIISFFIAVTCHVLINYLGVGFIWKNE